VAGDRRRTRKEGKAGKHEEDGVDTSEHGAKETERLEWCKECVGVVKRGGSEEASAHFRYTFILGEGHPDWLFRCDWGRNL
jgi:hypothetical protein